MTMDGRVAGKVALVTGAASGIGRAAATKLAENGAAVVCADIDSVGAQATANAILQTGGTASPVLLDITDEDRWVAVVLEVIGAHGRLDVLINSAGISFARPIVDLELEDWRRVLTVNLEGVFLGTKHAIRAMREGGGGSIVNVSSASGLRAAAGASAYSASKAAVCMFSRVAAKECLEGGYRIRVNSLCPGGVKTPMWESMPFFQDLATKTGSIEGAYQAMSSSPGERFAVPEEIAAAILYLASDESAFVTGTELVIDNGFTA